MKTIRAEELPQDLSAADFLRSVDPSEDILVEAGGLPRVLLVSAESVGQRQAARKRLFALIDCIRARHVTDDSDAILKDLEAAG